MDDYIGNDVADSIAGALAEYGKLPNHIVSCYEMADARAWKVQEHLCRAMLVAVNLYPDLKHNKAKRGKRTAKIIKTPAQMGHEL
eukprot:12915633-Heterocapsa_arctica.AAC.1